MVLASTQAYQSSSTQHSSKLMKRRLFDTGRKLGLTSIHDKGLGNRLMVTVLHKQTKELTTYSCILHICNMQCQVSVWQLATLLPISCKSVLAQPSKAIFQQQCCREQSTLSQDALSQYRVVGGQNFCYQCVFRRRRRTRPTIKIYYRISLSYIEN